MQRSRDRFLTTHTGSLPRPDDLIRMMYAKEEGVPVDPQALAARVNAAVAEIVRKQADAGVDLVNDGEFHHVAVTYDGILENLYLDGALIGTIPFTQQGYSPLYYYEIGTGYTGGWDGAPGE